jgi:hypothetical protein
MFPGRLPTAAETTASASASARWAVPVEALCRDELLSRLQSMHNTLSKKRGLSILITGRCGVGKSRLLDDACQLLALSREPSQAQLRADMSAGDRALISTLPGTQEERMDLLLHSGVKTVPTWVTPFRLISGGESARLLTALQLKRGCQAIDDFGCCLDEQSANMAAVAASRLLPKKLVLFASQTPRLAQFLQPDYVRFTRADRHVSLYRRL